MGGNELSSEKTVIKKIATKFPKIFAKLLYRAEEYSKGFVTGGTLFEELGFFYVGPIDGHNIKDLVSILRNISNSKLDKPIFLHIITKKGKGYLPAEKSSDKFHGVEKFDVISAWEVLEHIHKDIDKLHGKMDRFLYWLLGGLGAIVIALLTTL